MFFFFNSGEDIYITVMGDIIESKTIKNRNSIQTKLKNILTKVNANYKDDIASKFSIIYGDGFQGLLRLCNNTMKIVSDIEREMFPTKLRFGVGVGKLTTEISESVYEIDGSCFHYARKMLDEVLLNESKNTSIDTNIMIYSGENNVQIDKLLNTILSLSYSIKNNWTSKQVNIINKYIETGENQVMTADKLNINKSSVSRSLSASNYYAFNNAIATVDNSICSGVDK